MPDCCVIDCNHGKSVKGEYQSFKFPEDPVQRREWVNAVKREKKSFILNNETVICKRHFTPDDLVPVFDSRNRPRKPRLKEGAVPTLHMGTEKKPKVVTARETRKSVDTLQVAKNNLEREVKRLKDENQLLQETVEHKDREIENLKDLLKNKKDEKEFDEMKGQLSALVESLKKIFTDDQVGKLKFPDKKIHQWSDATLRICITIYLICGSSAYKYLIAKGFPFVPIPTLQAHMSKVNFDAGILTDIFIILRYKIEELPTQHRHFGLVMDEMSIQPKLDFNIGDQSFIGKPNMPIDPKTIIKKKAQDPEFDESKTLATHAMNFLLCGLCKRVKQIIAWFLTFSSFDVVFFADILKKIVVMCHDAGAILDAITIDMSGQNQKI